MSLNAFRALIGLCVVMVMAIYQEAKKDGWQWSDLFGFLKSDEFHKKIGPTVEAMPDLIVEIKEFKAEDGFDLGHIALDVGKELYVSIKAQREASNLIEPPKA